VGFVIRITHVLRERNLTMKRIKFNKQDKQQFRDWDYSEADIEQIVKLRYRFHNYSGREVSYEEAVNRFSKYSVLGAISRAAFHGTGSISVDTVSEAWGVQSNLIERKN
jgi:hypothetical protein